MQNHEHPDTNNPVMLSALFRGPSAWAVIPAMAGIQLFPGFNGPRVGEDNVQYTAELP